MSVRSAWGSFLIIVVFFLCWKYGITIIALVSVLTFLFLFGFRSSPSKEDGADAAIHIATPFRVPDPVLMESHRKAERSLIAFEERLRRLRRMGHVLVVYPAMVAAFAVGYHAGRPNDDEGRMIRSFDNAPQQPLPSPSRSRPPRCQCREVAILLIEGRVLPPVSLREPWPHLIIDRIQMLPRTFSFCR